MLLSGEDTMYTRRCDLLWKRNNGSLSLIDHSMQLLVGISGLALKSALVLVQLVADRSDSQQDEQAQVFCCTREQKGETEEVRMLTERSLSL